MSWFNTQHSQESGMKVALFGSPRTGIREIMAGVSEQYEQTQVASHKIGEAVLVQTFYLWPKILLNDKPLRINLYGLSGKPDYNAINELLLKDLDGVIFVADVSDEDTLKAAVEAMKLMVFNLQRLEYNLQELPVALHYHRVGAHEAFNPELMDQFLGITPGSLPRFCSKVNDQPAAMSAAVTYLSKVLYDNKNEKIQQVLHEATEEEAKEQEAPS